MTYVKPKKHLGQHFLKDLSIARQIVDSLKADGLKTVVEVGPGTGVLTQYLLKRPEFTTHVIEVDNESIEYLNDHYPELEKRIHNEDFLRFQLEKLEEGQMAVIGNFPYNISSQIFFHILDYKDQVTEVVGMLQKEVAERIASPEGNKAYGILSVLLQAWYKIDYLFTVHENVFNPPPKVKSAVIRLTRNNVQDLGCDEVLFKKVIKMGFNQRRKTLRNSLRPMLEKCGTNHEILDKRPEQLSVAQFVELTNLVGGIKKPRLL
jgi:16S rRNA (adenine1518-N6/adenine1519-N6)-dimethyltransferase